MDDQLDVLAVETETTLDSSPEIEQPTPDDVKQPAVDEPVDDMGVPIKNRVAEAQRKARKIADAQTALLDRQDGQDAPRISEEDALALVRQIAREELSPVNERLATKLFLLENPDAADLVDDINRVRRENPELRNADKLELAYRVAKAERLEEQLRIAEEQATQKNLAIKQSQGQGAIEGAGKVKAPTASLVDRIANATTEKELLELEQYLR